MSALRSAPKVSAPLKAPEVANKDDSRLEYVLSVGHSNMSVNKAAAVLDTGKKPLFATAHKAPIVNVGISMLRKTQSVVPKADIGVTRQEWKAGNDEEMVKLRRINIYKVLDDYIFRKAFNSPATFRRAGVHRLWEHIDRMGNRDGVASPNSVNRGFYIYLLQVFEEAIHSAMRLQVDDGGFLKIWVDTVKNVENYTLELARGVLTDQSLSTDDLSLHYAYFEYVNRNVYNFFTDNDNHDPSPNLTAFLAGVAN